MKIEFGYFHFKSINYIKKSSALFFSNADLFFSNFIIGDSEIIGKYTKEIFTTLNKIANKEKDELIKFINSENNYDFIDSNFNLEKVFWTLREYGLSERFIIKKMFRGENIKTIEYLNSDNELDVIEPFMNDNSLVKIFKIPIKLESDNRVRLLILWDVSKEILAPLFIDNQHVLFSSSKINEQLKDDISIEFYKLMHILIFKADYS